MRGDDEFDFSDISDEVYNATRAAELAAEGAALRASARAALMHRVALTLLGVSMLLGIAMLLLPALRPWSEQAMWVLMLGLTAYLAVVAIAYWSRPTPRAPEMRELLTIRHQMAALYVELQRSRGAHTSSVLLGVLADAIRQLDEQLGPALQELLNRRANLQRELRRYERGQTRTPSPAMLARLQRMLARTDAAINECLQQAVNAYATLIALLQIGNDEEVANRARAWADGLTTLHDTLVEVLHGADDPGREDVAAEPHDPEQPGQMANDADPVAADAEPNEAESAPVEPEPAATPYASSADKDFLRQVREALGCLRERDLGKLGRCDLVNSIPFTIAATLRERRNGYIGDPTLLEQAQALREILIAAVDRLRPEDEGAKSRGGAVDVYRVLLLYYLEGRTVEQIEAIVAAANRTVYRRLDSGVPVVAWELLQQEARHARGGAGEHGPA